MRSPLSSSFLFIERATSKGLPVRKCGYLSFLCVSNIAASFSLNPLPWYTKPVTLVMLHRKHPQPQPPAQEE